MKSNLKQVTFAAAVLLLVFFMQSIAFAANPVRVIRDEFGVPHVFAKNIGDLYFGYGYVTSEDRLFQIEMLKRSVQGRAAEVLGKKFIELDRVALRDGYSLEEIGARLAALPEENLNILDAFAAGLNKRIAEVHMDRRLMPAEFIEMGFEPEKWSAADVASIFAGTMAVRYSDFTAEMDNMNLMKFLTEKFGKESAQKIFDDVVPLDDPLSVTTLESGAPVEIKKTNSFDDGVGSIHKNNGQTILSDAGNFSSEKLRVKSLLKKMGLPSKSGSYFYAISGKKSKSGNSILVNGPQMGFFTPAYLFEAGLHCPGYNVVGTTTPCYMNMMFGMNENLAFGATAGVGNLTDVYIEKLNPKNSNEYLYCGEYKKFEKRVFKIAVKGKRKPETFEFLRSVHGPIFEVDKKAGVAYAKKRAWENREIQSMFAWMEAVGKRNFNEMKNAMANNAISINNFASNRSGEIYYYLSGLYPLRKKGFDDRLPLSGDGSAEWSGFSSPLDNPCGNNESEGYLVNWNAKPEKGFINGDLSAGWGPDQRTYFLKNQIFAKEKLDMDDMLEITKAIGYTDIRAALYVPLIISQLKNKNVFAPKGSTSEIALEMLSNWDYTRRDADENGHYDSPAVAFFDALWPELMGAFFSDTLGELTRLIDSDPTWTQSGPLYYILAGLKDKNLKYDYTKGAQIPKTVAEAVDRAFAKLSAEYKTSDTSKWLKRADMLVFDTNNFTQVPQTSAKNKIEVPMVNRGTENHFIELGPGTTNAININAPGQSGFHAAGKNAASAHTIDQLELFKDYKGYKPMRFEITDIIKNKTSEKFIFND